MLKEISSKNQNIIKVSDFNVEKSFSTGLEYSCPVHENWNIVHTGMLIPEAHQIYVCPQNCLRGVIMTADEMGAADRISGVEPSDKELYDGSLEEVTIRGVSSIIESLSPKPPCVMVFLPCMHHFVGADIKYIYKKLSDLHPDIDFLQCWMDPIMTKVGLTPEQKERLAMIGAMEDLPKDKNTTCMVGDNLRLPECSDIGRILQDEGMTLTQVHDVEDYDAYKKLGKAQLFITRSTLSVHGLEKTMKKRGRKTLYLPPAVIYDEIDKEIKSLYNAIFQIKDLPKEKILKLSDEKTRAFSLREKVLTENALKKALEQIKNTPISIDYLSHPRPLGLSRLLISHGFNVVKVYLDAVSKEEYGDLKWLKENSPNLSLHSTNHVLSRIKDPSENDPLSLAIGPKAAFFKNTPHYVNIIEADGHWGYEGIRHLADLMVCAMDEEKEIRNMVENKALTLLSIRKPRKTSMRQA